MSPLKATEHISTLQCPHCFAENEALGGGKGYADTYVNHAGALWGVCVVHGVRWYVTRELIGFDEDAAVRLLSEVEGHL